MKGFIILIFSDQKLVYEQHFTGNTKGLVYQDDGHKVHITISNFPLQ